MRIAVAGGTGTAGRHAVVAAEAAGHDVRVLSRSSGVDVYSGTGLAQGLSGVESIVDAIKPETLEPERAIEFFRTAASNLQREGGTQGVRHIVTLSIVGIERVPGFGFYNAQLERERAIRGGLVPVTIMRATQFHEFPAHFVPTGGADSLS
jgi:uncharacterized protein YbjT (DUF2867 family)